MSNAREMTRKMESQMGTSAVGTAAIALPLGRFLASLAAAAIGCIFIGIFYVFSEIKRPFILITSICVSIGIAAFLNIYFHWFGARMLTPAAMLLLFFIAIASSQALEEIDAIMKETLPKKALETSHRDIAIAFFIFIFPILFYTFYQSKAITGLYVWAGLSKGHAVMAMNATLFMLVYFFLVVLPQNAIKWIMKRGLNEMIAGRENSTIRSPSIEGYPENFKKIYIAENIESLATLKQAMLNIINRINKKGKIGLTMWFIGLSFTAAYVGLIWYFAGFNISNYDLGLL